MILMFSRDPGGANQMVAVHRLLADRWRDPAVLDVPGIAAFLARIGRPKGVAVLAKDFAADVWRRTGEPFTDWADLDEPFETLFGGAPVAALVTATSDVDDDTDAQLWRAARDRGIASHVFVDQDSNVMQRFALARPDYVYVPSDTAHAALIGAGFDERRVDRIPDLHLASQMQRMERDAAAMRRRQRNAWRVAPDRPVILFASENVAELTALGKLTSYSEFECLERLLAAIAEKRPLHGRAFTGDELVVIRPHPKDLEGKYDGLAARFVNVVVSNNEPAEAAILGADIVAGMRSSLLAEAKALGRPVVGLVAEVQAA